MTFTFWVIMIILVCVFAVALFCCIGKKEERLEHLLIAIIMFIFIMIMKEVWVM